LTIFRLDPATRTLQTIDYAHHQIHAEDAYTSYWVVTHGAAESPNILMVTPDTNKWSHLIFQVISDDVLTVGLYETPSYSGGSPMTPYNRNRNSSKTAGLTVTKASASSNGKGTLIWTFKAGANKTVTTSESARFEFILKQNEKYLLEGVGANADNLTFLLDWYELTRLDS